MPRDWQFATHDHGRVDHLARQIRCSTLLAQVLMSRGLEDAEAARAFLSGKLTALQDPELVPGVEAASKAIVAAVQAGRRITIYGDYDVDGMTSTAILSHCLQRAGAKVDYYIPCRLEEGYGLNSEAIRELHKEDRNRLVVTVDCGICSVEEARLARELKLDLIITDHHTLPETLPEAIAVVHPRLTPESKCCPDLCGAGVAFKLAWAIAKLLGDGQRSSETMREFLKMAVGLAMIGTVADVVPLVGENRLLVKYGLETLRDHAEVGLQALIAVAGAADKTVLSAEDIGFGISPRLNAAGRLGQARLGVELLTTTNPERAQQLATYLEGLNKNRQTVERKILRQAREEIQKHPEWAEDPVLVISHADWHPGVIGIVASRIADQFGKPTILIAMNPATGIGQGSGRTVGRINLHQVVTRHADRLKTFGGHAAAIGLKIEQDQLDEFRRELASSDGWKEEPPDDHPRRIDAEVTLAELTVQAIQELEFLGPFGSENERPLFVATGLELAEPPKGMGEDGRHFSGRFRHYGTTLRAISFGRGEWVQELTDLSSPVSVCFKPLINEFRGRKNVELQVIDWRVEESVSTASTIVD